MARALLPLAHLAFAGIIVQAVVPGAGIGLAKVIGAMLWVIGIFATAYALEV